MANQHPLRFAVPLGKCMVVLGLLLAGHVVAADDPVLLSNGTIEVRRSDYELELQRLAPDMRGAFATVPSRVHELVEKIFYNKLYAAKAREAKLDQDPAIQQRLALETERFYGIAYTAWLEEQAGKAFDADLAKWEARAKEIYTVDMAKYVRPERVSVSHILFKTEKRTSDEAQELARKAAARAVAGENFTELARNLSEDPSAKRNGGRIDNVARGANMDPAFVAAAFALAKPGDVSGPVQTRFGWHVIKLESRQAGGQRSFEDAKPQILAELRQKFVNDRRDATIAEVRAAAVPGTQVNQAAIDALIVPVPQAPRAR